MKYRLFAGTAFGGYESIGGSLKSTQLLVSLSTTRDSDARTAPEAAEFDGPFLDIVRADREWFTLQRKYSDGGYATIKTGPLADETFAYDLKGMLFVQVVHQMGLWQIRFCKKRKTPTEEFSEAAKRHGLSINEALSLRFLRTNPDLLPPRLHGFHSWFFGQRTEYITRRAARLRNDPLTRPKHFDRVRESLRSKDQPPLSPEERSSAAPADRKERRLVARTCARIANDDFFHRLPFTIDLVPGATYTLPT